MTTETTNYMELLSHAKLAAPKRGQTGSRTKSTAGYIEFTSDKYGRPRINISSSAKRRFIKDGNFSKRCQLRYNNNTVFLTFTDSKQASAVSGAVEPQRDDNGLVLDQNGNKQYILKSNGNAYISIQSLANSWEIRPQELYGKVNKIDFIDYPEIGPTYVVNIPHKSEEEIIELVAEDNIKSAE